MSRKEVGGYARGADDDVYTRVVRVSQSPMLEERHWMKMSTSTRPSTLTLPVLTRAVNKYINRRRQGEADTKIGSLRGVLYFSRRPRSRNGWERD